MKHYDGLTRVQRGRKKAKEKYQLLRQEVLTHYGNGELACVWCKFGDMRALSIDHLRGDGHYLRVSGKEPKAGAFYKWLKDNSYPEGYQTLCMNCQFIKRAKNSENTPTGQEKMRRKGLY